MSMRYPGGIISATAPTVNTASAKGVWTLEQVAQYVKAGTWPVPPSPSDVYFEYVTTLLPGTGTNGAQNNTFLDSSSSPKTITRNGNSTQGTFSPFSQTGWGNYFDGNGDYIVSATNTGLNISSGDFTVEFWVYATTLTGGMEPLQFGDGTNGYSALFGYLSGSNPSTLQLYLSSAGSSWDVSSGQSMGTITANEWIHYAVTRSGNTFRTFKNGTLVSSFVSSSSIYISTNQVSIGNGQGTHYWFGYVSNARVVKGTALYTASFTPSTTPLTAVSGTSLLTCQSNRFIDNSTNALAITVYGNTAVHAFSPFNPTAAWSSSTNGGSGYFDGTGDYLNTTTSISLSGDFTIETWQYQTNAGTRNSGVIAIGDGANAGSLIMYTDTNQYMSVYFNGSAIGTGGGAGYAPANAWHHYALVRSGSTVYYYIDGKQVYSFTGSASISGTLYIGASLYSSVLYPGQGYMASTRILSGTALYTGSTYTVPTSPFTAITNTVFLSNYTNAGITDATAKNDFETSGNAQISTAQSKWGGGSIYFDNNASSYLTNYAAQLTAPTYQKFGLVFTIEFWIYRTSTEANQWLMSTGQGYYNATNKGFLLGYYPAVGAISIAGTDLGAYWFGGGTINTNSWYHVAVVGANSGCTIYINGTQVTTSAWPGGYTGFESLGWIIGCGRQDTNLAIANPFGGYISDLRITNGVSRYTTNFTPPDAAFQLF